MDEAPMEWSAKRVVHWLKVEVGLPKYANIFLQRNIELSSLLGLTEDDLEGLGITDRGDQGKIMNAISVLWGRVDSGQRLTDDDFVEEATPIAEVEVADEPEFDLEAARQQEDLLRKRVQYQEREHVLEQISRRVANSLGVDLNNVPGPFRLLGDLGSADEDIFVPPPPVLTNNDRVDTMVAESQFEELESCQICIEEKSVNEMATLTCGHSFCFNCLGLYVQARLSEDRAVVCPSCSMLIAQEDIERILSPPVFGPQKF